MEGDFHQIDANMNDPLRVEKETGVLSGIWSIRLGGRYFLSICRQE